MHGATNFRVDTVLDNVNHVTMISVRNGPIIVNSTRRVITRVLIVGRGTVLGLLLRKEVLLPRINHLVLPRNMNNAMMVNEINVLRRDKVNMRTRMTRLATNLCELRRKLKCVMTAIRITTCRNHMAVRRSKMRKGVLIRRIVLTKVRQRVNSTNRVERNMNMDHVALRLVLLNMVLRRDHSLLRRRVTVGKVLTRIERTMTNRHVRKRELRARLNMTTLGLLECKLREVREGRATKDGNIIVRRREMRMLVLVYQRARRNLNAVLANKCPTTKGHGYRRVLVKVRTTMFIDLHYRHLGIDNTTRLKRQINLHQELAIKGTIIYPTRRANDGVISATFLRYLRGGLTLLRNNRHRLLLVNRTSRIDVNLHATRRVRVGNNLHLILYRILLIGRVITMRINRARVTNVITVRRDMTSSVLVVKRLINKRTTRLTLIINALVRMELMRITRVSTTTCQNMTATLDDTRERSKTGLIACLSGATRDVTLNRHTRRQRGSILLMNFRVLGNLNFLFTMGQLLVRNIKNNGTTLRICRNATTIKGRRVTLLLEVLDARTKNRPRARRMTSTVLTRINVILYPDTLFSLRDDGVLHHGRVLRLSDKRRHTLLRPMFRQCASTSTKRVMGNASTIIGLLRFSFDDENVKSTNRTNLVATISGTGRRVEDRLNDARARHRLINRSITKNTMPGMTNLIIARDGL